MPHDDNKRKNGTQILRTLSHAEQLQLQEKMHAQQVAAIEAQTSEIEHARVAETRRALAQMAMGLLATTDVFESTPNERGPAIQRSVDVALEVYHCVIQTAERIRSEEAKAQAAPAVAAAPAVSRSDKCLFGGCIRDPGHDGWCNRHRPAERDASSPAARAEESPEAPVDGEGR